MRRCLYFPQFSLISASAFIRQKYNPEDPHLIYDSAFVGLCLRASGLQALLPKHCSPWRIDPRPDVKRGASRLHPWDLGGCITKGAVRFGPDLESRPHRSVASWPLSPPLLRGPPWNMVLLRLIVPAARHRHRLTGSSGFISASSVPRVTPEHSRCSLDAQ